MAKIIIDDATLRKYIPNVLATVDDETALFDKLSPSLDMAESWLIQNLTGQKVFDKIVVGDRDTRFVNVAMFVVTYAFAMAIPSLDLVLTPNGFGVVSNNNVAPASKERVERLINSLYVIKSQCLTSLLPMLRADVEWHDSEQCQWLASSIIQDIKDVEKFPHRDVFGVRSNPEMNLSADRWKDFLLLREKCSPIEQEIANGWISSELMNRLCSSKATATWTKEERYLCKVLKNIVLSSASKGALNIRHLEDAVSYIRSSPNLFPEWHSSATAELFTPPIFKNEKKSGGHFF